MGNESVVDLIGVDNVILVHPVESELVVSLPDTCCLTT